MVRLYFGIMIQYCFAKNSFIKLRTALSCDLVNISAELSLIAKVR